MTKLYGRPLDEDGAIEFYRGPMITRDQDNYIVPPVGHPLRIHLGCWTRPMDPTGWINIDQVYVPGVDLIEDCRFLRSFRKMSVDAIYASHILDEFTRWEYMTVLKRWHDLLKMGGRIYLSVPDFDAIVDRYLETHDVRELEGLLHGGQDHPGWTRSYSWNMKVMKEDLMSVGFQDIRRYNFWERPFYSIGRERRDDYSQAYLPHGNRETGRLMSLNVEATK